MGHRQYIGDCSRRSGDRLACSNTLYVPAGILVDARVGVETGAAGVDAGAGIDTGVAGIAVVAAVASAVVLVTGGVPKTMIPT